MPTKLYEILEALNKSKGVHSFDQTAVANAVKLDSAWDLFGRRLYDHGAELPPKGSDERAMLIAAVMVGATLGADPA